MKIIGRKKVFSIIVSIVLSGIISVKLVYLIGNNYSRHIIFWTILLITVMFASYYNLSKSKQNNKEEKGNIVENKYLKTFLYVIAICLALIPLLTFIFQYWPTLSVENVDDFLYGHIKRAPEDVVSENFKFNSPEEVLSYFEGNKIKYLLPGKVIYTVKNQSQSVVPDVITRYVLLSVKSESGKVKNPIYISHDISSENFSFAPLESRGFIVDFGKFAGKTKKEMSLDDIYLIVVAYCRPVIFPFMVVKMAEVFSYSDEDRLWVVERDKNLEDRCIKEVFKNLQGILIEEDVSGCKIVNYIENID